MPGRSTRFDEKVLRIQRVLAASGFLLGTLNCHGQASASFTLEDLKDDSQEALERRCRERVSLDVGKVQGMRALTLKLRDCILKRPLNTNEMITVTVGLTRPEEPFQSILLPAWDNVDMKVGDALTDSVVDRYKSAFGPESFLGCLREQLRVYKQGSDEPGRQVGERIYVFLWNKEAVPRKHRTVIQKGQREIVLKHAVARDFSSNDLAESAIGADCIGHEIEIDFTSPT